MQYNIKQQILAKAHKKSLQKTTYQNWNEIQNSLKIAFNFFSIEFYVKMVLVFILSISMLVVGIEVSFYNCSY